MCCLLMMSGFGDDSYNFQMVLKNVEWPEQFPFKEVDFQRADEPDDSNVLVSLACGNLSGIASSTEPEKQGGISQVIQYGSQLAAVRVYSFEVRLSLRLPMPLAHWEIFVEVKKVCVRDFVKLFEEA
ncbi:hypothetical protein LOK49_LG09G00941 [Camellia lanceoleosa]|uniref:Uncharacterized protein n=1 Tax=Camellia lanceoleosa TaxID=1840588 RepID=A0ACC0GH51_9ERIC|nr:hypothetical protein LOK49_LG09G00941 [Camellia lanceoleosa]